MKQPRHVMDAMQVNPSGWNSPGSNHSTHCQMILQVGGLQFPGKQMADIHQWDATDTMHYMSDGMYSTGDGKSCQFRYKNMPERTGEDSSSNTMVHMRLPCFMLAAYMLPIPPTPCAGRLEASNTSARPGVCCLPWVSVDTRNQDFTGL